MKETDVLNDTAQNFSASYWQKSVHVNDIPKHDGGKSSRNVGFGHHTQRQGYFRVLGRKPRVHDEVKG